jgi:hypothetical protein
MQISHNIGHLIFLMLNIRNIPSFFMYTRRLVYLFIGPQERYTRLRASEYAARHCHLEAASAASLQPGLASGPIARFCLDSLGTLYPAMPF